MAKGAIIYSRVSTQGQADEGASLETQITGAMEAAEEQGSPVLKVYREIYTGAELYDRPLLAEARREIKSGQYSHLIAYSIDRLSRDPIHLAIIAMECERQEVELIFVTEKLDDTPEGRLIRYVRGYAAQVEREKIRERCVGGKRTVALSGRIHRSGTDLYGYTRDKIAGKRIVNEPEAVVVREIFDRVLKGASVRSIYRHLNAAGIPAPSIGKRTFKDGRTPRWGKGTIARILYEPSYKGEAIAWRWKGKKVCGRQKIVRRPIEENIRLPEGTSPVIVEPEIWDAVQKIVNKNGAVLTRNMERKYLLRGFIYCYKCERRCYTEICRGVRYYRCSSRASHEGRCGARMTQADICEEYVWESLKAHVLRPDKIKEGMVDVHNDTEMAQWKRDLKNAKQAIAKSEAGIDRLMRRFAASEDEVLADAVMRTAEGMKADLPALRKRVTEIESLIKNGSGPKIDPRFWQSQVATVAANLEAFGFEDKALTLRACDVKVFAAGKRVVVAGDVGTLFSDSGRNTMLMPFRCDNKKAA